MADIPGDALTFSFDLLAGAHRDREILSVCPDGHLVVKGRTHWAPLRFATDRPSLICGFVDHPEPALD